MPELLLPGNIISMDARAADRLMAAGAGDAALLYLWLLRHGGQLSPDAARKGLKWDGQRLEEAAAQLVALGLSDGKTQAEAAPVPAPAGPPDYTAADIAREIEAGTSTFPGLVNEVQRRLGKVLSTADLKSLYTLYDYLALPAEDAGYTEKVAAHVDEKVREVLEGARVSLVDGAVLAAVNIADEYFKEVEAAENLRRQLKEYLEEATKLKLELSEAKREIFKLENKKQ